MIRTFWVGVLLLTITHHGTSSYDMTKLVTLTGTVTEVQWEYPHVHILLDVPVADGGGSTKWIMELVTPGILTDFGWSKDTVKPKDKVTVEFNPRKDGTAEGRMRKLTFPKTGKSFESRWPGEAQRDAVRDQ